MALPSLILAQDAPPATVVAPGPATQPAGQDTTLAELRAEVAELRAAIHDLQVQNADLKAKLASYEPIPDAMQTAIKHHHLIEGMTIHEAQLAMGADGKVVMHKTVRGGTNDNPDDKDVEEIQWPTPANPTGAVFTCLFKDDRMVNIVVAEVHRRR